MKYRTSLMNTMKYEISGFYSIIPQDKCSIWLKGPDHNDLVTRINTFTVRHQVNDKLGDPRN